MKHLILALLLVFLCQWAQAQELWVSFGVAAGRPDHELHVKSDGTVEGRKYGDGYTLNIGPSGTLDFFERLKGHGLLRLPGQYSYGKPDCLSFMLTFEEGDTRVEVSGGDPKNARVKAVYEETWSMFEMMVREGKPRR